MTSPHFVPYTAAALMIAVSLYCVGRLALVRRSACRGHIDVNISHAFMGVGMAGMLVPSHNPFSDDVGTVIFGLIAAWFFVSSVRFVVKSGVKGFYVDHEHGISHPLIHMVMAGAMIYMYDVIPSVGVGSQAPAMAMSGGSADGPAVLTLGFVLVLLASAVLQLDTIGKVSAARGALVGASPGAVGATAPRGFASERAARPRLEVVCHVAMCVTMGYMLLLMV